MKGWIWACETKHRWPNKALRFWNARKHSVCLLNMPFHKVILPETRRIVERYVLQTIFLPTTILTERFWLRPARPEGLKNSQWSAILNQILFCSLIRARFRVNGVMSLSHYIWGTLFQQLTAGRCLGKQWSTSQNEEMEHMSSLPGTVGGQLTCFVFQVFDSFRESSPRKHNMWMWKTSSMAFASGPRCKCCGSTRMNCWAKLSPSLPEKVCCGTLNKRKEGDNVLCKLSNAAPSQITLECNTIMATSPLHGFLDHISTRLPLFKKQSAGCLFCVFCSSKQRKIALDARQIWSVKSQGPHLTQRA